MAHPGITYTFEAQGHKEYYTVTNDSAQVIVITDGMELVDSVPQSEPEPAPPGVYGSEDIVQAGGVGTDDSIVYRPGAVVKPPHLAEFKMNMLVQTVGPMSSCHHAMLGH